MSFHIKTSTDSLAIGKNKVVLWLTVTLNDFMYLEVSGTKSPTVTFSAHFNEDFGKFSFVKQSSTLLLLECRPYHTSPVKFLLPAPSKTSYV